MRSHTLATLPNAPQNRIALQDELRVLTYAELRSALECESQWLRKAGVRRCALLADNSVAWVIADLTLMNLRFLNVPLPTWFTVDQIAHSLNDAGVESVLTDQPDRMAREHTSFECVGVTPRSGLTLFKRKAPNIPTSTHDMAKITYTSGSTGTPKGVCLSFEAMERVVSSIVECSPAHMNRHLCLMPLATLLENIAGVYAPLRMGATCVAVSSHTTGIGYGGVNPGALLSSISTHSPSSLILVPELLRLLVASVKRGWSPPRELRFIAVGGAAVAPALIAEANALGLPVFQGYGLSECASVVCLNTPTSSRAGSVGRPLPHARVRIDDQGQIIVRGALMSGYLGDPPSDHRERAQREFATGDLGSIDADGFVYVRGRIKNMFITSMGRNVSPEWIESELLRDAAIAQAVVVGEARPWPVALITPSAQQVTDQHISQAIAAANTRLPNYAQVHGWVRLPEPLHVNTGLLTANGRPKRDAIVERYRTLIDPLYHTSLAS